MELGRLTYLGRHDVLGDCHDLLRLCACLWRLRHVHVHLVPVEIGIVGRRDRQVQPECRVWQDLDSMALRGKMPGSNIGQPP